MKRLIALLLPALLLCSAPPGRAETDSEGQIWNAFIAQAALSPGSGLNGWLDTHLRRRGSGTLLIVRPGLGYGFTPELTAHVGYALVRNLADNIEDTDEHRIWQQIIWNRALSDAFKLGTRARFEQRFSSSGDDIGHRLRLFLRGMWAPTAALPIQLVGWDEFFIQWNDTDWAQPLEAGFDQNRVFLGVGANTVLPGVRVEIGYMNIFIKRSAVNHLDHVLAVNLFINR